MRAINISNTDNNTIHIIRNKKTSMEFTEREKPKTNTRLVQYSPETALKKIADIYKNIIDILRVLQKLEKRKSPTSNLRPIFLEKYQRYE